jgi:alpha-beta hydrolase superfamily lysophospholipase
MRTAAATLAAVWLAAAVSIAPVDAAATAEFAALGGARELKGAPGIFEWTFDATRGASPWDRIAVHHIARGPEPAAHPEIVVLYLPGTNMNGEVAYDDPRYSLPVYLATRGVDVWTLDYRTHFVPPETPSEKLGELRAWTYDVFLADIAAAAKFVSAKTGRSKLFVAGFSRGATLAYLFAAENPGEVAGLLILDGYIGGRPMPGYDSSKVASDLGGKQLTFDKRHKLLAMVIANADGPAPIPQFKTARENLIHVVERPGALGGAKGLANPSGGFSDPVVLAKTLSAYDRWWPNVHNGETPFSAERRAALKDSKVPVIAFASTNVSAGWAAQVEQSAHATGSGDVKVIVLKDWGHLDVICGTEAEQQVFAPLAQWLKQHQTAAQSRAPAGE